MFGKEPRNFALGALAILLVTLAVYTPAMRGGFIWDDDVLVVENPLIRSAKGLGSIWAAPVLGDPGFLIQYYPLVYTVFSVERLFFGDNPLGYHWVNVLLHAFNAILLWMVLRRLAVSGAFVAAALFAVHPVHVESVAWISELKNVLSGSFYFLSLLAYLRFLGMGEASPDRPSRRYLFYAFALVCFMFALFSKTVTASLAVVVLLLIWCKKGSVNGRDVLAIVPFFVLGIVLGVVTIIFERSYAGTHGPMWALSLPERVLVAGRALWFYIGKLVLPIHLTFIYPRWTIDAGSWWQYLYPLSVFVFVFTLWTDRARLGRGPFTAVAIFVVTLIPALGFFNVFPMLYSFVADHFQYLASAGLIALFSAGMARALKRPALVAVSCAILLVLGALTWRQGGVYKDLETLWRDTLSKNPSCWMAHVNLGRLLSSRGDSAEAVFHYQQALTIWPGDAGARNNLAIELANSGQMDAAIGQFQEAVRLWPGYVDARCNLAIFLAQQGKTQEAIAQYRQVLQIRPDHALARENLNRLLLK